MTDETTLSPEAAAALAALRAKLTETPDTLRIGHVHDTSNDMQAFLELPDCEACAGTGKDDHGSPFEAPLAVHFAGPPVEIVGRRRQLCMWCGHVLSDVPLKDAAPAWAAGEMIRVEDGLSTVVPYLPCDTLPPGCCALPDDEDITDLDPIARDLLDDEPAPGPACYPPVDGWDGTSIADDEPSQAQETRAAADWPAEPVNQRSDEQEADRA